MLRGMDIMALRTIRKDDDSVLRKVSKPVDKIDDKIKDLISDMLDTMYDANGVGLAAVQVGILKRIIVIDIYDGEKPKILLNPEIIDQKGKQYEIEGCLSVPGIHGKVERPSWVKVKGIDASGKEVVYEATDLLARAFCHEIDHLDGTLFVDKADIVDECGEDDVCDYDYEDDM
jgi:peptide deformylase